MKCFPLDEKSSFQALGQTPALLSSKSVIFVLQTGMPDVEWLLDKIESQDGWFRFPPYLSNVITNLKIENYPLLYSSESAIVNMLMKGFLDDEQIMEFNAELEAASPEDGSEFVGALMEGLDQAIEQIEIPKTPQQQKEALARFNAMSPEEQKESVRVSQHFFCFFFASFYQNLSVMVHGEKLTSLVVQAQTGNDEAFVKAVQIDRRILTSIPYFRERYARAQDEANSGFYDLLSYRLSRPPYRGKIRYKSLWLAFSILDQAGLLVTLPHREILEMCDEAGVGGFSNRVQDVNHLSRRIKEYREFQKRGLTSTP